MWHQQKQSVKDRQQIKCSLCGALFYWAPQFFFSHWYRFCTSPNTGSEDNDMLTVFCHNRPRSRPLLANGSMGVQWERNVRNRPPLANMAATTLMYTVLTVFCHNPPRSRPPLANGSVGVQWETWQHWRLHWRPLMPQTPSQLSLFQWQWSPESKELKHYILFRYVIYMIEDFKK